MVRRHPHPVSSTNRPTLDLQYPVSDAVPYACNRIGVGGGSDHVDDAGGAVVGSGGASTTASTVPTLPSTISSSTVVQPRIIR